MVKMTYTHERFASGLKPKTLISLETLGTKITLIPSPCILTAPIGPQCLTGVLAKAFFWGRSCVAATCGPKWTFPTKEGGRTTGLLCWSTANNIWLFIYSSFNKYLLMTYYVPGLPKLLEFRGEEGRSGGSHK